MKMIKFEAYKTLNNMISAKESDGGETTYTYDPVGNLLNTKLPNKYQTVNKYDALSRLLSMKTINHKKQLDEVCKYTYDNIGNKLTKTKVELSHRTCKRSKKQIFQYSYDKIGQLIQVKKNSGTTQKYFYDTVGNRIQTATDYTYNELKQLTALHGKRENIGNHLINHGASFAYDDRGNLTQIKEGKTVLQEYSYAVRNLVLLSEENLNCKMLETKLYDKYSMTQLLNELDIMECFKNFGHLPRE